jgi:predicted ATPase
MLSRRGMRDLDEVSHRRLQALAYRDIAPLYAHHFNLLCQRASDSLNRARTNFRFGASGKEIIRRSSRSDN